MVTTEELDKAEADLRQRQAELSMQERQAVAIAQTKIPVRRYTSGVTPDMQQQTIRNREQGQQALREINNQRQNINRGFADIQNARDQIAEAERIENENKIAEDVAFGKAPPMALTTERQRQLARQIKAGVDYQSKINTLRKAGIKPVYVNGQLAGFEDSNTGSSYSVSNIPGAIKNTPASIEAFKQTGLIKEVPQTPTYTGGATPQQEFNQIVFGTNAIDKIINPQPLPMSKAILITPQRESGLIEQKLNNITNKTYYGKLKPSQFALGIAEGVISTEKTINQVRKDGLPKTGLNIMNNLGKLTGLNIGQNKIYAKELLQYVRTTNPQRVQGRITYEVLTAEILGRSFNYAKEKAVGEVVLKVSAPAENRFISETVLSNVRSESLQIDIAKFQIVGINTGEYSFTVPRYQLLKYPLRKEVYQNLPLEKLESLFPKGKTNILIEPKVSFTATEPFYAYEGRILGPTNRLSNEVRLVTKTGTNNRLQSTLFSTIEGSTRAEDKILFKNINRDLLNPQQLLEINKLEDLYSKTSKTSRTVASKLIDDTTQTTRLNIDYNQQIKKLFGEGATLESGDIIVKDFAKLNSKGKIIDLTNTGKTISRAELKSVSESKVLISKETSNSILKEIELLNESIAVRDITFPKFKATKNILKIEGSVRRYEFDVPSPKTETNFIIPSDKRSSEQFLKSLYGDENRKTINKQIAGLALQKSNTLNLGRKNIASIGNNKALTLSEVSNIASGTTALKSQYYGKGTYEKTDSQVFKSFEEQTITGLTRNSFIEKPRTELKFNLNLRNDNKNLQSNIQKDVLKEINKEQSKYVSKSVSEILSKQVQKDITKQITKQINKVPFKSSDILIPNIRSSQRENTKLPRPMFNNRLKSSPPIKLNQAYKTFIIRGRKRVELPGVRSRGQAIRYGERIALSNISATFGIKKGEGLVYDKDINFTPSKKLFRDYKIQRGKRVPLVDTFIQRQGKRLYSRSEVDDLLSFKIKR
jgi:hypothetical protein